MKRSRVSVLKPPRPAFPADVSPLYALFVPYGCANDLDIALAQHVMCMVDAYSDMEWYESETDREAAGRCIDFIQLALTCHHAFAYIQVKRLSQRLRWNADMVHNEFFTTFTYGRKVTAMLDRFTCENGHIVAKTKAALLAAYVGRTRVASLVCPKGLQINAEAFHLLALKSPRCRELDAAHFREHPLCWPTQERVRGPADLQYYWWLNLTLMFNVPDMGPLYLKASVRHIGMRLMTRWNDYILDYCHPTVRPYLEKIETLGTLSLQGKAREAYVDAALRELQ